MTPPDQIPVIPVQHEAVWINAAFGLLSMRPVAHLHSSPPLNCHAESHHYLAVGLWGCWRGEEDYGRLNSLKSRPQTIRQHALDLGERAFNRMRVGGNPLASRGEQTEQYRKGFVVGQHQRRHLEPGLQTITAGESARSLYRDAQIPEHGDISPRSSLIHFQPRREFHTTYAAAGL
jgi:hypothetical protein